MRRSPRGTGRVRLTAAITLTLVAAGCSSASDDTADQDRFESIVDGGDVVFLGLPAGDFLLDANPIWDALRTQLPAPSAQGISPAPRSIAPLSLGDPVPDIIIILEEIPAGILHAGVDAGDGLLVFPNLSGGDYAVRLTVAPGAAAAATLQAALDSFIQDELPALSLTVEACAADCFDSTASTVPAAASCPGSATPGAPHFEAVPGARVPDFPITGDYVELHEYPPGASVLVEVRATPGGPVLAGGSGSVGSDGHLRVTLTPPGFDLVETHHVTVIDTGTGLARETTIVNLEYTFLGQGDDLVQGTAPPGAVVEVLMLDDPLADSTWGATVLAQFTVIADAAGAWSLDTTGSFDIVDDGAFGPGSGFQTDMVAARTADCDGDATLLFCPFC